MNHPVIQVAMQSVKSDPEHYLHATYRLQVYRLLKPALAVADGPYPESIDEVTLRSSDHIRYGRFAIATARSFVPHWQKLVVDLAVKSLFEEMLTTAEQVLSGEMSKDKAELLLLHDYYDSMDSAAYQLHRNYWASYLSAYAALGMVLGIIPLNSYSLINDESLLSAGKVDDVAVMAAIAHCVEDPNPPGRWTKDLNGKQSLRVNSSQQLAFWEWWLELASEFLLRSIHG